MVPQEVLGEESDKGLGIAMMQLLPNLDQLDNYIHYVDNKKKLFQCLFGMKILMMYYVVENKRRQGAECFYCPR